jgi:ubiquinol-cytochrome c reductase cytochrome b subunit
LVVITAFFFQAPLESIANPQSTPLHTVAPWYFYWLQGMLKIADKMVAGVILPGVLLVLLAAIPYLDFNPSRRAKDRRVAIISGIVAGIVMIILSWMGTPQYAVQGAPAVEIVQERMPEEGAGLVREIAYRHLPIGIYDTRQDLHADDAEFNELLHEFKASVAHFDERDDDFNNAYGILEISQNQAGLKRIHWQIHWISAQGTEEVFDRSFYLHEDSMYWEQYGLRDFSYMASPGQEE